MKIYSINYDLSAPGRNYAALTEKIKAIGTWWHYLESTWLVQTSLTADQIYNRLADALDKNDSILVIDVGQDFSGWLPKDAWTWIRQHQSQTVYRY